jgi:hypothetical protein
LLRQKAIRGYPITKVTTPVAVEGAVDGGALPMGAGTSFHGRRKLLDPRRGAAVAHRSVRPMQDVHAFGPQLRDIASELLLNGVKEDERC